MSPHPLSPAPPRCARGRLFGRGGTLSGSALGLTTVVPMAEKRRLLQMLRLFFTLLLPALPLSGQQLELRFLDVGQADAVVIRQGGKTALVDAGSGGAIVDHLRALRIDTLDLVVASHNHADHIGGMTAVS